MKAGSTFIFGEFRFTVPRMELTREGVAVPLGSRAAEILLFLIRHAGDAVHKNALLGAIWPDRVVEENNLTVHMAALRRALGDNTTSTRFILDPSQAAVTGSSPRCRRMSPRRRQQPAARPARDAGSRRLPSCRSTT